MFLLFPGLYNDAFKTASRHSGTALLWTTTPAARILRHGQGIQHPRKWLWGFRRLWDAPPPTAQTDAGAVDAGAQTGMFSVKVMRRSIWIPATRENSLCYTQKKKILLPVTYRKFIVRVSRYPNGIFTELKDSWVHWFPQSQDLTSRSVCCDHFSLTFGLIVCGLS